MAVKYNILNTLSFRNTTDWNIKQHFNKLLISSHFEFKSLKKAIKRVKTQMSVENKIIYKRITIKTNCGGVVLRDELLGENIKTKNQYYIKKGQLAVSKIDARNGAFGIVPNEADGAIITGNFWVYDVNSNIANIDYLILMLSSNMFVQAWQDCSNGSGNRLYLQEHKFLDYKIPLPSLKEQNEIIYKYNDTITKANDAQAQAEELEKKIDEYLLEALGIEIAKVHNNESLLSTVNFSAITQWGYDKISIDSPFIFNKYVGVSFNKSPMLVNDIFRGKSPKYKEDSSAIILNQKCNRWNEIDLSFAKNVDVLWLSKIDKDNLTKIGDIIINSTGEGTLGRASLIRNTCHTSLLLDSHMLLLRTNIEFLNPQFFVYLLNSSFGQYQIDLLKGAQATKQTELGVENIKKFIFPLPLLDKQEKIVATISEMKAKIKSLRQQANTLRQMAKQDFERAVFDEA